MPAMPAWPPGSTPRLYVPERLAADAVITLAGAPAHYLGDVLRLREGAQLRLFDDRSGEWQSEIEQAGRKRVQVAIRRHLRPRETVPDLWLLFAPVKRGRIDWLVEKATELGVAELHPVISERTIVERVNLERLRAHAIEAAEQCERTALPRLEPPRRLDRRLDDWPDGRVLHFADEAGGTPLAEAARPAAAANLIGPEGGFSDAERRRLLAHPAACPVSLGPRILRADTAALAAIALWMAAAGDWSS
ncbi:MAG: 16S rRNA (uracil(1498)-N(3))-methyltransferase, partial [Sphingosinicella sp.]